MAESTITFTKRELVQFVQKIQDLALQGAFIFLPGMHTEGAEKITPPNFYKPRTRYDKPMTNKIMQLWREGMDVEFIAKQTNLRVIQVRERINYLRKTRGVQCVPYRNKGCNAAYQDKP